MSIWWQYTIGIMSIVLWILSNIVHRQVKVDALKQTWKISWDSETKEDFHKQNITIQSSFFSESYIHNFDCNLSMYFYFF